MNMKCLRADSGGSRLILICIINPQHFECFWLSCWGQFLGGLLSHGERKLSSDMKRICSDMYMHALSHAW